MNTRTSRTFAPLLLAAMLPWRQASAGSRPSVVQPPRVAPAAVAIITGTVRAAGDVPVADAVVEFRRANGLTRRTRTAANGTFRLGQLPIGEWSVRVTALGYAPGGLRSVMVTAAAALPLDITLRAAVQQLGETVVSATRTTVSAASISASTTVLDRTTLQRELTVSANLADALGRLVPGLGAGNQSMSTYGQTLRGRDIAVLVDGVPLSTSRNVLRDLTTIDPSVIDRVEVIRGASAIYGDGATGGVINLVTRRAGGDPAVSLQIASGASLTSEFGQGGFARITPGISGTRGAFDYTASVTRASQGLVYDADGDVVPVDPNGQGGIADTDTWDAFAKVGYTRGKTRVQLAASRFDLTQETDWTVAATTDTAGKAVAVRGRDLETPQNARNQLVSLDLSHASLLGGAVTLQGYWRDYLTRFNPFAFGVRRPSTGSNALETYPLQSFVVSEKVGFRLQHTATPSRMRSVQLSVGIDGVRETTEQRLNVFDRAAFASSAGTSFRRVDEWSWVPPLEIASAAAFAQVVWTPVPRLALNGGVRHERADVTVDDFQTINEVAIRGGTVRYRPTLWNGGAVLTLGRGVAIVANASQGFSLADVGRVLRAAPAGFTLGSRDIDAQRVDQYEVGLRGGWTRVRAELVGFRNRSELGTQLDANLNVLRAPERVYGAEGQIEVRASDRLSLGAVANWSEGEYQELSTGRWRPLNAFRIVPWKATAYADATLSPRWSVRAQVLRSGDRDRATRDGATFGGRAVSGFTTVDASSSLVLGRGRVVFGVENLLNALYFPPASQQLLSGTAATRAAGRGRMLSVTYALSW